MKGEEGRGGAVSFFREGEGIGKTFSV